MADKRTQKVSRPESISKILHIPGILTDHIVIDTETEFFNN